MARMLALIPLARLSAAIGLNEVAAEVMAESQELVPYKYGVLKGTGKVSQFAKPDNLEAKLTYGTEYAAAVHEIPEPPAKSKGGRSARHEHGQWKYLETPLKAREKTLQSDMAKRIGRIMGTQ